jgi:hypothetical protein
MWWKASLPLSTKSVPSVAEWVVGSRFVQRTVSPTAIVRYWPVNWKYWMSTSTVLARPGRASATPRAIRARRRRDGRMGMNSSK